MDTDERDEFIRLSFAMGMGYKDIARALAVELGVNISLRHLKRQLNMMALFRRKHYTDIAAVIEFIQQQLEYSGRQHGYRWMFEKCKKSGHDCKNEDVREILRALDPGGVLLRSRCKLRRRS